MVAHDVRIRAAGVADVRELADLGTRTFLEAYGATNDPADLASYIADTYTEHLLAQAIARPEVTYLIAEVGGRAVGFAKLVYGSRTTAVDAVHPAELEQLYVEGGRHGGGLGTALLTACLNQAREHGCDLVWLGVWEHNPRAIGFYERTGFARVGSHSFRLGAQRQTDLLMAISLEPAEGGETA